MSRFSHWMMLAGCTLTLLGCDASAPPPPSRPPNQGSQVEQVEHLRRIVEHYWDESAALSGWYYWGPSGNIAPQAVADTRALEHRYLDEVSTVPRAALDAESQLTYDMFRTERLTAIEGFTYPFELLPVNPYDGVPQRFALTTLAAERTALSTPRDFGIWRSGAASFARWTTQAIANMRDGLRRGYSLPRPIVAKAIPLFGALGADTPENVFYKALPDDAGGGEDAARPSGLARTIIRDQILPAYGSMHDFLQNEYLPRARSSVSISSLPLGEAWYAFMVKRVTGGPQTAAQLHAIGVAEMERLHQKMQSLLSEASFTGNAQAFLEQLRHEPQFSRGSAAELTSAYEELKGQVATAVPALFESLPQSDFDMRPVEAYREAVTPPLSYRLRSPSGTTAAVLYVNTSQAASRPTFDLESQYLRTAVPGILYQREMQQEHADLPRFRRFAAPPAFAEGWGLYALTLGGELGLYRDAPAKFGALLAQMLCAAGLVIDTGVHALGWTRQQALDYLHLQVPVDEATGEMTVDRILSLPSEALACTVGFLKIQGLRAAAQQSLGSRFDLRAFHRGIIGEGAMPLDLLEGSVRRWEKDVLQGNATGGPATGTEAAPAAGAN